MNRPLWKLSTAAGTLALLISSLLGCQTPKAEDEAPPRTAQVERRNQSTVRENVPDFPDEAFDQVKAPKDNAKVPKNQDPPRDKILSPEENKIVEGKPQEKQGKSEESNRIPEFQGGEDLVKQLEEARDRALNRGTKNFGEDIPLEYEQEIGRGVAAVLMVDGLVTEPESVLRYVSLIAATLGAVSSRPEVPFVVGIIDNDSINAFAAPGGYLFISKGLLSAVRDEAELAAALSHEIGHICARHGLAEMGAAEGRLDAQDALSEMDRVFGNQRTYGEEDLTSLLGDVADKAYNATREGYSRDYETDADRRGLTYLIRAGYDPRALIDLISRLEKSGAESAFLGLGSYPSVAERIESIRVFLNKRAPSGGARLQDRFQEIMSEWK